MKKLFGRKLGSGSDSRHAHRRGSESHAYTGPRVGDLGSDLQTSTASQLALTTTRSVPESDELSLYSETFSESETLALPSIQCSHLQATYQDNFTSYAPYLVRRQRMELELNRNAGYQSLGRQERSRNGSGPQWDMEDASDDERTMVSEPEAPSLMHRSTTSYNHKRTLIIASELIRNNIYVFPCAESFELFKHLRASSKKLRKSSIVIYDENTNVRRIYSRRGSGSDGTPTVSTVNQKSSGRNSVAHVSPGDPAEPRARSDGNQESIGQTFATTSGVGSTSARSNKQEAFSGMSECPASTEDSGQLFSKNRFSRCTIDSRPHIVPLDYKVKGQGLPLLKVVVPYMSTFRRKTPYMIFRRFIEKPKPPTDSDAIEDEQFETYDFCTVHIKNFQHYKRYTFVFSPENSPSFKILAYQNNYRPFTDFNYKGTRFRVTGTPITMAYLTHYNPELKLHIIDKNQPSLMDNIIDKKASVSSLHRETKRDKNAAGSGDSLPSTSSSNAYVDFIDPIPHHENPILLSNIEGATSTYYSKTIPHEMPPFGLFQDSCAYLKHTPLLPKKYSEIGKIEVYQDPSELRISDFSSSLSVDLDSLVLSTVLLALRETSIRTTVKHPGQSHASRMGLLTAIALNTGGTVNNSTFG